MRAKSELIMEQAPAGPAVVVSHSLGANVVALALSHGGLHASHLIFAEPALYDISRGNAAVEAYIAPMEEARSKASAGDLFGYWQIVKPIMFGGPAIAEEWSDEEAVAKEFSSHEEPWGQDIGPDFTEGIAALVVTGGWNEEYEAIADTLVTHGASKIVLPGYRHRVQDHPQFNEAVECFVKSA